MAAARTSALAARYLIVLNRADGLRPSSQPGHLVVEEGVDVGRCHVRVVAEVVVRVEQGVRVQPLEPPGRQIARGCLLLAG